MLKRKWNSNGFLNSSLCCEITIAAALTLKTFVALVTTNRVPIFNEVEQHFGLLSFLHYCHLSCVVCVSDACTHTHTRDRQDTLLREGHVSSVRIVKIYDTSWIFDSVGEINVQDNVYPAGKKCDCFSSDCRTIKVACVASAFEDG